MRQCLACGAELSGDARKRYCGPTCRKRGSRQASVTEIHPSEVPTVVESTQAALVAADRLATPAGAAAMVLATKLDQGRDTGSAVASLVRELRATMAEALANTKVAADPVDELRRKREERQSRVGGA